MKRVKNIFLNLIIMCVTSLILRTIGIYFQVYLSKKIGAEGIGLFQLITSIYFLAIVISISGIRFTATRLIAEEIGTGNQAGVNKVVRNCLIYSIIFSAASMFALYFSSEYIGTHFLNDARTIISLRIFAVSLPFISMSSVLNGYFIAVRRAMKTSAVQLAEQIIKISATMLLLVKFLPLGLKYACAAVVTGSCIGEIGSFLIVLFLYIHSINPVKKAVKENSHLVSRMLHIALPVALSAYIASAIGTVQQLLVPFELKKSGISNEKALSLFGMICGMVMPVIMFPSVLIDSVCVLIVPELAECKANNSPRRLNYIIVRVFNLSCMLSVCVMWVFIRFYKEFGMSIYNSTEVAFYIKIFAPLIPFMYLDDIVDNMLKGIGEQVSSMRYNIAVSIINVFLIYLLLPRYAVTGYIITIYFSKILNFSLSIKRLIKVTKPSFNILNIIKSVFCIISSVSVSDILLHFFNPMHLAGAGLLYFQIPVSIIIYIFLLRAFSCITHDDIIWIKSLFK